MTDLRAAFEAALDADLSAERRHRGTPGYSYDPVLRAAADATFDAWFAAREIPPLPPPPAAPPVGDYECLDYTDERERRAERQAIFDDQWHNRDFTAELERAERAEKRRRENP